MWRLARRALIVACLLAAGASFALWCVSLFRTDVLSYRGQRRFVMVRLENGSAELYTHRSRYLPRDVQVPPDQRERLEQMPGVPREAALWHEGSWHAPRGGAALAGIDGAWREGYRGSFSVRRRDASGQYEDVGEHAFASRAAVIALPTIMLGALIAPCAAGLRTLARRRADGTICAACGYDLRATSGECPECGAEGADQRDLRVGRAAPVLLAAMLLAASVLLLGAIGPEPNVLAAGQFEPWEPAAPGGVPSRPVGARFVAGTWGGALALAITGDAVDDRLLWPSNTARLATPRLTGQAWLEPAFAYTPAGTGNAQIVLLPLWIAFAALWVPPALWIRSVRHRGGFRLARLPASVVGGTAPA